MNPQYNTSGYNYSPTYVVSQNRREAQQMYNQGFRLPPVQGYSNTQMQGYNNPQMQGYNNPQMQGYNNPQMQNTYGQPQMQNPYGQPQMQNPNMQPQMQSNYGQPMMPQMQQQQNFTSSETPTSPIEKELPSEPFIRKDGKLSGKMKILIVVVVIVVVLAGSGFATYQFYLKDQDWFKKLMGQVKDIAEMTEDEIQGFFKENMMPENSRVILKNMDEHEIYGKYGDQFNGLAGKITWKNTSGILVDLKIDKLTAGHVILDSEFTTSDNKTWSSIPNVKKKFVKLIS